MAFTAPPHGALEVQNTGNQALGARIVAANWPSSTPFEERVAPAHAGPLFELRTRVALPPRHPPTVQNPLHAFVIDGTRRSRRPDLGARHLGAFPVLGIRRLDILETAAGLSPFQDFRCYHGKLRPALAYWQQLVIELPGTICPVG